MMYWYSALTKVDSDNAGWKVVYDWTTSIPSFDNLCMAITTNRTYAPYRVQDCLEQIAQDLTTLDLDSVVNEDMGARRENTIIQILDLVRV